MSKNTTAPPGITTLHRNLNQLLRLALVVVVYLTAFTILDFNYEAI